MEGTDIVILRGEVIKMVYAGWGVPHDNEKKRTAVTTKLDVLNLPSMEWNSVSTILVHLQQEQ